MYVILSCGLLYLVLQLSVLILAVIHRMFGTLHLVILVVIIYYTYVHLYTDNSRQAILQYRGYAFHLIAPLYPAEFTTNPHFT